MSSFSPRRAVLRGLVAGLLSVAGGCGFKPLYGVDSASHAPATASEFAAIDIPVLRDRVGQELRNKLIDSLHPAGPAGEYRYRLDAGVREADISLGLQGNSTSTRGQIKLTAQYSLIDLKSGKNLLHETLRTSTGYNILVNQFGTVLSTEDSRQRALQQIADDMTEHLALYFARPGSSAHPDQGQ